MSKLNDMIKIGDIHASRIAMALRGLKDLFPLEEGDVLNFSDQDLMYIELLISRFAKLQDHIGQQLFNEILKKTGDYQDSMTMINKLNMLERFRIIKNAALWQRMREARNHAAHEYPDHPALTALYLNHIYELTPDLLTIFDEIKKRSAS